MPLYTVTTQMGVLSKQAKSDLAAQLTTLHCQLGSGRTEELGTYRLPGLRGRKRLHSR